MPRWKPDGVERLREAAFELFDEQGFERTTVAEIARRAGLTERTFYNHFADKREALFNLGSDFQDRVVAAITAGTGGPSPLDTVVGALRAAADELFEGRRLAVSRRRRIIDTDPGLRERELSKRAELTAAIAGALRGRGLTEETAMLVAGAGMLVQQTAERRWARPDDDRPLSGHLDDALRSLHAIAGPAGR